MDLRTLAWHNNGRKSCGHFDWSSEVASFHDCRLSSVILYYIYDSTWWVLFNTTGKFNYMIFKWFLVWVLSNKNSNQLIPFWGLKFAFNLGDFPVFDVLCKTGCVLNRTFFQFFHKCGLTFLYWMKNAYFMKHFFRQTITYNVLFMLSPGIDPQFLIVIFQDRARSGGGLKSYKWTWRSFLTGILVGWGNSYFFSRINWVFSNF